IWIAHAHPSIPPSLAQDHHVRSKGSGRSSSKRRAPPPAIDAPRESTFATPPLRSFLLRLIHYDLHIKILFGVKRFHRSNPQSSAPQLSSISKNRPTTQRSGRLNRM